VAVPSFDDSQWPLLQIRYGMRISGDEADAYHRTLRGYLMLREPFVVLADARAAEVPPPRERQRMADFIRETEALSRRCVAGMALVMRTPAGRGVLTAVLWLKTPPFPMRAFGTVQEAAAWCRQQLATFRERTSRPPGTQ
jgi:hypothetical protein